MTTIPGGLETHVEVEETGNLFEAAAAVFDRSHVYRYLLTRTWTSGLVVLFVMLNPSTADAGTDDPTLRRCRGFARRHGFGGLAVVNLFALRATDPAALSEHPDPVGPATDAFIATAAADTDRHIAAWGAHPAARARAATVAAALTSAARRGSRPGLACLGLTKTGQPRHPLYLPSDSPLTTYPPGTSTKEPIR